MITSSIDPAMTNVPTPNVSAPAGAFQFPGNACGVGMARR